MRSLQNKGFSLVELMVVLAIVGLLIVLSIPNFTGWIQNSKTRSIAESIQNGLRYAQGEAVSLNRLTTFDTTTPTNGWTVTYIPNAVASSIDTLANPLQTSPVGGLGGAVITAGSTSYSVIVFTTLGRASGAVSLAAATAGTVTALPATGATFDVTNPNGPRKSRIVVYSSGKVRMCDPDAASTRPDACY